MYKFSHSKFLPTQLLEATDYLQLFYQEHGLPESHLQARLAEVYQEYRQTETYWQTLIELAYGAKVAWRNSTNCIGRIFWQSLTVRDLRHLTTAQEIFAALVEHIELATNKGSIRPYISIFAPQQPGKNGIRIWNSELIRYAGYRQADGSVVGDPAHCKLTETCQQLGWVGKGTRFDVLPVIIQMPDQPPQWFEIPSGVILEVPISHPDYPWFADFGLKWHALPAVSDWRLEIGGISYPASPFNGWYMGTEIGARNFGDVHRYNLLPIVAEKMGLNTRSKLSLWKDQALVALNTAVLYSFAQQGVSIVDHHTASSQFMQHMEREAQAGRMVPADWGRIVPPISASATEVFHREMKNVCLKPNFFSQETSYTVNYQYG
ncbi:nitric oxide synthase oxygenase [Calothrix sp. NIES-4071]|nr:nitric oxide synthase oxygenase [Calothrix sp. NIES-4071]BAZ62884.1 nitric oxide synthase oxygenase [Calothrix sp. NIES-4105]